MKKLSLFFITLILLSSYGSQAGTPIPITFQILGVTNNQYNMTDAQIAALVCSINNRYAATNNPSLHFYVAQVRRFSDAQASGVSINNFKTMFPAGPGINFYLSPAIQIPNPPPGPQYVNSNNEDCIKNCTTDPEASHEIGHYFGLAHPVGCGSSTGYSASTPSTGCWITCGGLQSVDNIMNTTPALAVRSMFFRPAKPARWPLARARAVTLPVPQVWLPLPYRTAISSRLSRYLTISSSLHPLVPARFLQAR